MAAVSTNDLKNGMSLNLPEGLFQVVDFQHVKPGKGGAFVRTTLRTLRNGAVIGPHVPGRREARAGDHRQAGDAVPLPRRRATSCSWTTRATTSSTCRPTSLGDAASYIVDGSTVVLQMYGDEIVGSDLPAAVELTVTETEPGVQGDRVSGRPQAGHARDRARRAGAAVREPRRPHQGRHPLGRVHHPRLMVSLATERRAARERALGLLYEAEAKGVDGAARPGRAAGPGRRLRRRRWCWRSTSTGPGSTGCSSASPRGGRSQRMAALDRAALRMGTAELLARADVPTGGGAGRDRRPRLPVLHRRLRPLRQRPPGPRRPRGPPGRRDGDAVTDPAGASPTTTPPAAGCGPARGRGDHRPRRRHPALGRRRTTRRPRSTLGLPVGTIAAVGVRRGPPGPGDGRAPPVRWSGARRSATAVAGAHGGRRRARWPRPGRGRVGHRPRAWSTWWPRSARDGARGAALQRHHPPARRPRALRDRGCVRRRGRLGRPRRGQAARGRVRGGRRRASASPLERCFFVDDTAGHVEAARALGHAGRGVHRRRGRCADAARRARAPA